MNPPLLIWSGDGGPYAYTKNGVRYLPRLHADWWILKESANGHFDMVPIKMLTETDMLRWFEAHNTYHSRWGRYLENGRYHVKTADEIAAYVPIQPAPNMTLCDFANP